MKKATIPLVFDTGPLIHFAKAGRLQTLKEIVGKQEVVITNIVQLELKRGAPDDPGLYPIHDTPWIRYRGKDSKAEIEAFQRYILDLVEYGRNFGEASVLALAETLPGIAVIDDAKGRRVARKNGILCKPTLRLMCEAIGEGRLALSVASTVADDLLHTKYHLPFKSGGFELWATREGLL